MNENLLLEVLENVKHNNKQYFLKAYSFSKEWLKTNLNPFSSEDLKEAFYNVKDHKGNLLNELPREPRVWGAVIAELKKDGLINFVKYQKYRNPAGHSRPSSVWISTSQPQAA